MLAYAAVEGPLAATLIRRGVEFGRVFASAALAVPLTVAAGIGTMVINPLVHNFGVARGSFLEFGIGVGVYAGIGYAAARGFARPATHSSVHQRGTVIRDAEPQSRSGLDPAERPTMGQQASRSRVGQHRRGSLRARSAEAITLAGIPVALLDETKHF